MKHDLLIVWVLLFSTLPASAQTVQITGRVIDESGRPLQNVNVLLAGREMTGKTDVNGRYGFFSEAAVRSGRHFASRTASLKGGQLTFFVNEKNESAVITLFNLAGKKLAQQEVRNLQPGSYAWTMGPMSGRLPAGMIVMDLQIGADRFVFSGITPGAGRAVSSAPVALREMTGPGRCAAAGVDSLFFWLSGYENAVYSLSALTATVPDIVLKKGIAFEPYFLGSGMIIDIKDSQKVHIPFEQRLHVVVFGEGYTQADLDNGKYEADLARWMTDVFQLRIASFLKEAFVIWKYRAPSGAHLTGDGTVGSYFKLPLSGGMMASSGYDSAAAITWRALARFPFPPKDFAYGYGCRNMVCSYMLYDSTRGRSGFSGQTRTFSNPAVTSQRISVCMALSQQHEFMHGMARLADEYYDRSHTPLNSSSCIEDSRHITNVVYTTRCDSLPWKHLLRGGAFNPNVDSLVGAFGTNGRFHPELKCLMNGTHHNADLFGGNGFLRTENRFCHWCEEQCAFRIYERVMVLPDQNTSWNLWVTQYRAPFYRAFGFFVPTPIPQTNNAGTPFFMPCN